MARRVYGLEGRQLSWLQARQRLVLVVEDAVGIVGAIIARFQPHGMARAMFATAVAQMMVALIALFLGQQQLPYMSVFEILCLNGFFAALFFGSARLFRKAAREAR